MGFHESISPTSHLDLALALLYQFTGFIGSRVVKQVILCFHLPPRVFSYCFLKYAQGVLMLCCIYMIITEIVINHMNMIYFLKNKYDYDACLNIDRRKENSIIMITKTKTMNLLGKLHGTTKVSGQCCMKWHKGHFNRDRQNRKRFMNPFVQICSLTWLLHTLYQFTGFIGSCNWLMKQVTPPIHPPPRISFKTYYL